MSEPSTPHSRLFREHDVVRSRVAVPGDEWGRPVSPGDVGAVVCAFTTPHDAYMVEFCNDDGETLAMPTMLAEHLELVWADES
ncbi:hypothetical protein Lcho_2198 [Leptothrix cholodnii SP-6]|uniref:DUF4926 domain-containing protein n=1 Tax=Leptothrix cholodnii (strain ATCC 51168 / LMG 8142 / SP-6) TaxID=395495 RepID=B1Y3D6_LEPCP|nr:DUF4926 domain-containing protein [Leptothrix cholodnii]ACB34464.1 hypothetical protein Lcho_2198 [Leptothrix cholodnii SP-6]